MCCVAWRVPLSTLTRNCCCQRHQRNYCSLTHTPTPTHTHVAQSHRRISAGWTPPSESIHIHGTHGTLSCSSARCAPCSLLVAVFRILNIFQRVFIFSRSNRSDATTQCRVPRSHAAPALDPNTFMPLRLDACRVGHGDHLVSSHVVVLLRLLFMWRSLCFSSGHKDTDTHTMLCVWWVQPF
jgi:hypothetical protein